VPQAKVVIFLRNQIDFYVSGYVDYVKKGGTHSPAKLIDALFNKTYSVPLDFLEYDKILDLYSGLFGRENVHVFLYEEFQENNQEFISKYSQVFDLHCKDELNFRRRNEKLRMRLFCLIKFTNKFTRRLVKEKNYYFHIPGLYALINKNLSRLNRCRVFGSKPENKTYLSDKDIQTINDYFRESNSRLLSKYGIDKIVKYGYPLAEK
jgi:hypothetical protein